MSARCGRFLGRALIDDSLQNYFIFAVLRFVLVLVPQTGYVHPDEFFQTTEVMTGDHFRLEHTRTWEFNHTLPLRSITLPFILLRVPWSFFEFVALYVREYFDVEMRCTYTLLVFPRIIFCLISYINDYCLHRVCSINGLCYEIRMLAFASSWVMLIFGTRTFSNTLELTFCSMLLCVVPECMRNTNTIVYKKEFLERRYQTAESIGERVKIWKMKKALPPHNFDYLLAMSSICVAGVFNRPTFLVFGAPMVFYWLLRGMGTRTVTFSDFNKRIALFILSSLPALLLFIFCDSLYYQHLTVGELQMLRLNIENFVFTPWNFIKYNLDANKTAEHGLHPRYVHLLVNIPLLYNVLGVSALVCFAQLMLRFFRAEYQLLPRFQSITGIMSGAIFVPLFFLSLINHQEPRFLVPLLFPIVMLHAPKLFSGFCLEYPFKSENRFLRALYERVLCSKVSSRYVLKIWYVANIALTIFFGFIHQAGVYPLAEHMAQLMRSKSPAVHVHLLSSHTYSLPLHLLNLPSSSLLQVNLQTRQRFRRQRDFYYYEYGSMELNLLLQKLRLIMANAEMKLASSKRLRYKIFLAIPESLSDDLYSMLQRTNSTSYLHFELQHIFLPHLATEAFPRPFRRHPSDIHPPHWTNVDLIGTCPVERPPELSWSYAKRQFSSFLHQFGLALYKVEVRRRVPAVTISRKHKSFATASKLPESQA